MNLFTSYMFIWDMAVNCVVLNPPAIRCLLCWEVYFIFVTPKQLSFYLVDLPGKINLTLQKSIFYHSVQKTPLKLTFGCFRSKSYKIRYIHSQMWFWNSHGWVGKLILSCIETWLFDNDGSSSLKTRTKPVQIACPTSLCANTTLQDCITFLNFQCWL